MTAATTILAVNLAALTCSTLFYGMFVVLFSTSMYLLVGRYLAVRRGSRHSPGGHNPRSIFRSTVFIAAVLLFCAVTAHWVTTVRRAFLAFIYFQHGGAAAEFYGDPTQMTELVQEGFLMISILIGDSLIIHRLWVVWEHRIAVIIFPVCTLVALTTSSAVSMYTTSRKGSGEDIFSDPWLTSNCILTLVTNVYSTVLITIKIWNITHIARPIGGSNLRGFLVIVVESAAIYASWAVFFTIAYRMRSLVQFLVIQSAPEVVGIVNALIHTRVGLGWAIEAQEPPTPAASRMAFAKVESVSGRTPHGTAGGTGTGMDGDVEDMERDSGSGSGRRRVLERRGTPIQRLPSLESEFRTAEGSMVSVDDVERGTLSRRRSRSVGRSRSRGEGHRNEKYDDGAGFDSHKSSVDEKP
ncbi:hypothetical protein R3P38DRAFT_3290935 [Favolaschia claudopus]|uniref:Uncharacterized protein n=1 Tax=Favolaschia claudopus TaxID=2862362 RepID=A0AAV9ZQH6_9AGAR